MFTERLPGCPRPASRFPSGHQLTDPLLSWVTVSVGPREVGRPSPVMKRTKPPDSVEDSVSINAIPSATGDQAGALADAFVGSRVSFPG